MTARSAAGRRCSVPPGRATALAILLLCGAGGATGSAVHTSGLGTKSKPAPRVPLAGVISATSPLRSETPGAGARRSCSRPQTEEPLPVCGEMSSALPSLPESGARAAAVADSTAPSTVGTVVGVSESMHSLFARWNEAHDPESGIAHYVFGIGRAPGIADVRWWQSVGTSLSSYGLSPIELGVQAGDTVYVSAYAINGAGIFGESVSSGPVVPQWEPLGEESNRMTIAYAGDWRPTQIDTLQHFLARMLPIIHEIYGPPSHAYTLTLVRDPFYTYTNVFFPSLDEVHMFGIYPQLLTHEILHAWRDNVILSSDRFWNFHPHLSGFEEGFAQGVSYACMNRYVELYPGDEIVPGNTSYGSTYDWDYDFHNTDAVTTEDYWSDYGGMGIFWLRYEMGAAAIIKIMRRYPGLARDFNVEYYRRLDADHELRTSRALARDIIRHVAPVVEGREAGEWVDRQHIFDCRIAPGRKIWVDTQHYPGWSEYIIFQRLRYYETFGNGSDWAWWDAVCGCWRFHELNGSRGRAALRDWQGSTVWQKEITVQPADNPPQWYGFGSVPLHLSTDDDTAPWPGDDPERYVLGLHSFGLYTLEVNFDSTTVRVPRVIGDTLRSTRGAYGGVIGAESGSLFLDHADLPPEAPLAVRYGAFQGARSWASVFNPRTGTLDSRPGRVLATFVDEEGSVYQDERNIDLGSWAGGQVFLFDTRAMVLRETPAAALRQQRLDFGEVSTGSTAFRTLALTNLARWTLRVDSVSTRGRGFTVAAGALPALLERGDTLSLTVAFAPDAARVYADTVFIANNSLVPALAVAVEGSGLLPTDVSDPEVAPSFALEQNVPNPFNPATVIRYALPVRARATLDVFDVTGKRVATLVHGMQEAGTHRIVFAPRDLPSGVYLCRLRCAGLEQTRRLLLLK